MKTEPAADTIKEFCDRYRISASFFFKMNREGWGPRTMKVGARTLVSREAAEQWRREREAASGRLPAAE